MEDALQLEGYLMKEKSKLSRLHSLTGDINKRYFRIRSVEGSPELALCYYKNITDSEVRGWIYLKDVTEIAENQDTIILMSTARTLHLYAETRAEHNAWVTGLANLCPDAIKILGRNALARKTVGALASNSPAFAFSTTAALIGKSFAGDERSLPNETPAHNNDLNPVDPHIDRPLDNEESSPSNDGNDVRPEILETPRQAITRVERRPRDKIAGGHKEAGEHGASWSTPRRESYSVTGRKEERDNGDTDQTGIKRNTRLHRPRDECVDHGGTDEKGRTRYGEEDRRGCRSRGSENRSAERVGTFERQDQVLDVVGSPRSSRRTADDIDGGWNARYPTSDSPSGCKRNLEERGCTTNEHGTVNDKLHKERSDHCSAELEENPESPCFASRARTEISLHGDKRVIARPVVLDADTTKQSRLESSDSDNVETIELRETTCHIDRNTKRHESRAIGHVPQQAGKPERANMPKRSNQDEEHELDEEKDIDIVVPIDVKAWENSHQWQSATSRLHRHISRSDLDATGTSNIPPPKEFLASSSLEPLVKALELEGLSQNRDPASARSGGLANKFTRRRRAADLEWNDGGETPDRPNCSEDKLAQPDVCKPVEVEDSEGDGCDDLDAEVEKQRRRAAAAVLALRVAAKEADEGAQVQSEAIGDVKRRGSSGTRGIVATYPSPAGPPPAALIRTTRRRNSGPSPWVAPAKTLPPA